MISQKLFNQCQCLPDILHPQLALVARIADLVKKAEGTSSGIDYNKPPKNFADAMSRDDASESMKHIGRNFRDSRTETQ